MRVGSREGIDIWNCVLNLQTAEMTLFVLNTVRKGILSFKIPSGCKISILLSLSRMFSP